MQPVNNALGVLSGDRELRVGMEPRDIVMLSAGVFVAMLLALLVAKNL